MRRRLITLVLLLIPAMAAAQETPDSSAVHGVLFYSPTCPHCREVMTQTLPPILGRYGGRLKVVSINVTTSAGQQLYQAAVQDLGIGRDRIGVPTLLVGGRELVGAWEIPNLLPAIVDSALAVGGIDWPPVPLVRRALAAQGILDPDRVASPTPAATEAEAEPAAPAPEPAPAQTPESSSEPESAPEPESSPAAESPSVSESATEAESQPEPESAMEPASTSGPEPSPEPAAGAGTSMAPATPAPTSSRPESAAASTPVPEHTGAAAIATPGSESVSPGESAGDTVALDPSLAGAIEQDGEAALAHDLSVGERLMLDPAGNGFAIAVLILMLVALGLVAGDRAGGLRIPPPPTWAIPVLSLVGMGVAAYLATVEMTGAEAVCGPVGHCNVVQQSPYARILGVPVGLLGVLGYAAILLGWWAGRTDAREWAAGAREGVWWLTLVATGFSLYLTFLEPFVIGASCVWCLTSAVIATLLLLAATPERRGVREPTSRAVTAGAEVNR